MGAAKLGKKLGYEVFLSDKGKLADKYKRVLEELGVEYEEGQHTEGRIFAADLVVKSPGIPDKLPMVMGLREKGIEVISEIEFAGRYTDAKMYCITGSNGKTTTTLLLYHILEKAGYDVGLAGNVGNSLAAQVADSLHQVYVVELSSFQLDGMFQFRCDTAILTNITPDHLDRYDYKFENYANSKFRILNNMRKEDLFIYGYDCEVVRERVERGDIVPEAVGFTYSDYAGVNAYMDGDTVVAVYYKSVADQSGLVTGLIVSVARYPLGQPDLAEWTQMEVGFDYASDVMMENPVYSGGKLYMAAGETILAFDPVTQEVTEPLDIARLDTLWPEGTPTDPEWGYEGVVIVGCYDDVLIVNRILYVGDDYHSMDAVYKGGVLAGVSEYRSESPEQLYLYDGGLRQVGIFTPLSQNGLEFFGNRFPMQF